MRNIRRDMFLLFVAFLILPGIFFGKIASAMPVGTLLYRTSSDGQMYGYNTNELFKLIDYSKEQGLKTIKINCGHVGMYAGKIDGQDMVLEAIDNGVQLTPAKYFVNTGEGEKLVGAKIPKDFEENKAFIKKLVESFNAKKLKYDFGFSSQKGPESEQWICVGLTEKIYESLKSFGSSSDFDENNILQKLVYEPKNYAINITPDGYEDNNIYNSGNGDCFAENKEFSKIAKRTYEPDYFLGKKENNNRYFFLPYTQFIQPTLKDVPVDIQLESDFKSESIRGVKPIGKIIKIVFDNVIADNAKTLAINTLSLGKNLLVSLGLAQNNAQTLAIANNEFQASLADTINENIPDSLPSISLPSIPAQVTTEDEATVPDSSTLTQVENNNLEEGSATPVVENNLPAEDVLPDLTISPIETSPIFYPPVSGGGSLNNSQSENNAEPIATSTTPIATSTDPVATSTEPIATSTPPIETNTDPVATSTSPIATSTNPIATSTTPIATSTSPIATSTDPIATSTDPIATTTSPIIDLGKVLISEFATRGPNGASDEFVELYNSSLKAIDLTGWELQYQAASLNGWKSKIGDGLPSLAIQSHGFLLLAGKDYSLLEPDFRHDANWGLSDVGGLLRLMNNQKEEVDSLSYGSAAEAGTSLSLVDFLDGQSAERKARASSNNETMLSDGIDLEQGNAYDSDSGNDFVARSIPEPQNSSSSLEPFDYSGITPENISDLSSNMYENTFSSITISWSSPRGVGYSDSRYYDIRYQEKNGDCNLAGNWDNASRVNLSDIVLPSSFGGIIQKATISNLEETKAYCFGIKTFNGYNWSSMSNELSVWTRWDNSEESVDQAQDSLDHYVASMGPYYVDYFAQTFRPKASSLSSIWVKFLAFDDLFADIASYRLCKGKPISGQGESPYVDRDCNNPGQELIASGYLPREYLPGSNVGILGKMTNFLNFPEPVKLEPGEDYFFILYAHAVKLGAAYINDPEAYPFGAAYSDRPVKDLTFQTRYLPNVQIF